MPCTSSEPSVAEIQASEGIASQLAHLANELTYSSDMLREYLLGNLDHSQVMKHVNRDVDRAVNAMVDKAKRLYVRVKPELIEAVRDAVEDYKWLNAFVTREAKMKPADFDKVKADQIEHRKDDIKRLIRTFAEAGDISNLRKVLDANPNGPLAPQLGFDPDAY